METGKEVLKEYKQNELLKKYTDLYDKLLNRIDEFDMGLVDRLLELERELTLLEEDPN